MKSSPEALKFFSDYIFQQLGIVYQEANFYQLDTRLQEIAGQLGFSDSEQLYVAASKLISAQMKLMILDIATNNETLFFRDPAVFDEVEAMIVGRMAELTSRASPFRVWSAACSYGQEPYTLAMLFEKIKAREPKFNYTIVATDISERALNSAAQGRYTQLQVQRGLPAMMLVKHFEKLNAGETQYEWGVKADLKKNIQFKKLNLLEPFGSLGPFDLVLCRNVLIYQKVERKKEILHKIYDRMENNGSLILGAAESLIGISDRFELIRTPKTTFFRKTLAAKKAS
jgi:chemotaxis protein methyltransferase CheR